jgi:hypothetical protein
VIGPRDSSSVGPPFATVPGLFPTAPIIKETLKDELFTKCFCFQMSPFINEYDSWWAITFRTLRLLKVEPEKLRQFVAILVKRRQVIYSVIDCLIGLGDACCRTRMPALAVQSLANTGECGKASRTTYHEQLSRCVERTAWAA